jgi:trimeric autotransporter adhesin
MRRMTSSVTGLVALGLMVLTAAPAFATDGNLPGGTSISVDIDSPVDGAVVPPGPVTVTGTAAIGEGVAVPATGLTYVLDASASTFFAGTGCGGDQNGDTFPDKVMDCEIAAAKELNAQAVSLGTVGDVGAVAFGSTAVTADVQPGGIEELVTGPASDLDGVGGRDIEQVLSSTISTNNDGSLGSSA